MNRLLDKILILTVCMAFYFPNSHTAFLVVPVLSAVAASAFNSFFERRRVTIPLFALYCAACFYSPDFLFFLPLVCYDLPSAGPKWVILLSALPVIAEYSKLPPYVAVLILLLILLSWLTERRTATTETLQAEYTSYRDTAREAALKLESKNKDLMEKQDYEVRIAMLNERNRIAREIHDNVGHLLTSAILQSGALLATCRDEALRQGLTTLKDTLTQGMNSIRNSVHDLHDESVDLENEISSLVRTFRFCPVTLHYDMDGNPEKSIRYAFIAVTKEALSNIARHSNATHAAVTLREHPGLYQLIVKDNGTKPSGDGSGGIGLKNIRDRVKSLNGIVNISGNTGNGFMLFISIPKENTDENRNH